MTALVSVAASFWGKAVVVSTPLFWGWAIRDRETFETNTRESVTIDIVVPIGFI
jgi:hypothetical protein